MDSKALPVIIIVALIIISPNTALKCFCSECAESNFTCTIEDGVCMTRNDMLYPYTISRHCLEIPDNYMVCDTDNEAGYLDICCYTDMCNGVPSNESATVLSTKRISTNGKPTTEEAILQQKHIIFIKAFMFAIAFFIAVVFVLYKKSQQQRVHIRNEEPEMNNDFSGSAITTLAQRTITQDISLKNPIGGGRFGQVVKGVWQHGFVAVKIFKATDESAWSKEVELYQFVNHNNILRFIASDSRDDGLVTNLLIILEYHENGSLCDYLPSVTLTLPSLLRMLLSIADGLHYLHTAVVGNTGKPSIAHRDIKSKNILVKKDGTCCICDLGLAVYNNQVNLPDPTLRGTARYLPPEFLIDEVNVRPFNDYKMADVYALGLVFWEVTRRCVTDDGVADPYEFPYYDWLPRRPDINDVRQIVYVQKYRPCLPDRWAKDQILTRLGKMMKESWHDNAMNRVTALNIKKTLTVLQEQVDEECN